MVENSYQNSTIAQILEAIINEGTFEGESHSNIADILLSILNHTEYTKEPKSVIADLLLRVKKKIEGEAFEPYDGPYVSRIAEILLSILNETEYNEAPQSRIAELLLELKEELEAYTELTASGSIASFTTNVVKPLVNGEFTIQAYQEGSGDPSPVNVRNIIPFNTQKITKTGKNLYNGVRTFANPSNTSSQSVNRTFTPNSYCLGLTFNNYMAATLPPTYISDVEVKSNSISYYNSSTGGTAYITLACPVLNLKWGETYIVSGTRTNCNLYVSFYKEDGTYIGYEEPNRRFTVPAETYYTCLIFRAAGQGTVSYTNIQLEHGSTPTSYEPYIAPEIKTVALGQDVYGGVYNSVTGNLILTHVREIKATSDFYTFDAHTGSPCSTAYIDVSNDIKNLDVYNTQSLIDAGFMSNKLKTHYGSYTQSAAINAIRPYSSTNRNRMLCTFDGSVITQASDISNLFGETIQIQYPLQTPIEIQLDPTLIETYDGSNNIFCDTGNSSVTYLYKGTPPESVQRLLSKGPSIDSEEVEIKNIEDEELEKDENILEPDVIEKEDER